MPTLRIQISNYNFIPQRTRKTKTKVSRRKEITKIKEIHKMQIRRIKRINKRKSWKNKIDKSKSFARLRKKKTQISKIEMNEETLQLTSH